VEPGQLIFARLSQAAPVAALVGYVHPELGQQYRIYPVLAPENTPLPYLVYQLISNVPDGSALCELDDVARVQVSLFADSYDGICTLARAIRQQLHRYETDTASLELVNEFDHENPGALCFFRSQDYQVELAPN
jgi:hypothetical protein